MNALFPDQFFAASPQLGYGHGLSENRSTRWRGVTFTRRSRFGYIPWIGHWADMPFYTLVQGWWAVPRHLGTGRQSPKKLGEPARRTFYSIKNVSLHFLYS